MDVKYDKKGNLEYLTANCSFSRYELGMWHQGIKPKRLVRILDYIIVKLEKLKDRING